MNLEGPAPELYLASSSPRRRELLDQLGVMYSVLSLSVDETVRSGEPPADCVLRLARAKAQAGWEQSKSLSGLPVLGADTVVIIDNEILGKPSGREDAIAMLQKLSGETHEVLSSVALRRHNVERYILSRTQVVFRDISPQECESYWLTGEPADKAGGYGIQGFGAAFVAHLEGSYSGVVGLPLRETAEMLQEFGVSVWNL